MKLKGIKKELIRKNKQKKTFLLTKINSYKESSVNIKSTLMEGFRKIRKLI